MMLYELHVIWDNSADCQLAWFMAEETCFHHCREQLSSTPTLMSKDTLSSGKTQLQHKLTIHPHILPMLRSSGALSPCIL